MKRKLARFVLIFVIVSVLACAPQPEISIFINRVFGGITQKTPLPDTGMAAILETPTVIKAPTLTPTSTTIPTATATPTPVPTASPTATLEPTATRTPSVYIPPDYSLKKIAENWSQAQGSVANRIYVEFIIQSQEGKLEEFKFLNGEEGLTKEERVWAFCEYYNNSQYAQDAVLNVIPWESSQIEYSGPIPPDFNDLEEYLGLDCKVVLEHFALHGLE